MERLIKDGDIILNGTKTREEAEKEAFDKLWCFEDIMDSWGIDSFPELSKVLMYYYFLRTLKDNLATQDKVFKELMEKEGDKECKKSM